MLWDPKTDPLFSLRHSTHSFVLSFCAGFINVGAYLACLRFVSHVTGFATLFGASVSHMEWLEAVEILSVPLFFILGSIIAGLLIETRVHRGQKPLEGIAFGLISALVASAGWLGFHGFFGPFGTEFQLKQHYLLLALLCTASGLMNAVITSASRGAFRSTHLTGTTTDLGLGLVRVWALDPKVHGARRAREQRANVLRIGTIAFFVLGSATGAFVFQAERYEAFLLPAGILAIQTLVIMRGSKVAT
ncbi:MAG: DUF1275 domain-containing protein [Bdellovibrionales bacterium]|nr:DUF1275 domain-containing protein [Bdellovibrionales bacterium]